LTKNHLDSKVVPDNNATVPREAQFKMILTTSHVQMRQDDVEKVLGSPKAPGLFFATTSKGEIVYGTCSEYY
jgi:hypothetical protein